MRVSFDPEFLILPGIKRDRRLEVFHLEPVFDIDGKKEIFLVVTGDQCQFSEAGSRKIKMFIFFYFAYSL